MAQMILVQKWEESEAGWGCRPDGYSLHMSNTDKDAYVKDYWAKQKAKHPTPPHDYERPDGTAYWVEETSINPIELKQLKNSAFGIRVHFNPYPGSGGIDGWRDIKDE